MEISKGIGNVQVEHLDRCRGTDTFGYHHGDSAGIDGSFESFV